MDKIVDNSLVGIRSNHDLGFNWNGSADFGRIVPFHVQELVATDKITKCKPTVEIQMLAIASPSFAKLSCYLHYFFVPTRLLWKDYLDFKSGVGEGARSTPPYMLPADFMAIYGNAGSEGQVTPGQRALFKHWTSFGLPAFFSQSPDGVSLFDKITTLPLRAYNQIWWDYFRDCELIPDSNKSLYLNTNGGREDAETPNFVNKYIPRVRSVKDTWIAELFAKNGRQDFVTGYQRLFASQIASDLNPALQPPSVAQNIRITNGGNIVLSNVDTIGNNIIAETNSYVVRQMEALLRLSERMSLSGKRQIDMLFNQYGVKPDFVKLQMCQYLGGAKQDIRIDDITSSADTLSLSDETGTPLGMKAGSGYAYFENLDIEFTAPEDGYLIGVFSVMPKIHFIQGLGKEWYRNTVNDWFRKELEHVGQIAVPRKEVGVRSAGNAASMNYDNTKNDETFAFTQPYYEYKRKMDVLAGDMYWYHYDEAQPGQVLDSNLAYIQSLSLYQNFPVDRKYTAENLILKGVEANKLFTYLGGEVFEDVDDHFFVDIDIDCIIDRPMDGYAVPTLETTEKPHQDTTLVQQSAQI